MKQTYPTCGSFCKTPVFVSVKSQCLAGGRWGEEFLDLKETKETTLEKEMAAHPLQCSCLGNPMDRARSLAGYGPWGGERVRQELVTK